MNSTARKIIFCHDNVVVSVSGPLKNEASFIGKLIIIEEPHGASIEWHPLRVNDCSSPDSICLDWEELTPGSSEFTTDVNDSLDAVEIKVVRTPNVIKFDITDVKSYKKSEANNGQTTIIMFLLKDGTHIPSFEFKASEFGSFCDALSSYLNFKRSNNESNLYVIVDQKSEALEKSFSELNIFSDSKSQILRLPYQMINHPVSTAMGGLSKVTHFFDYLLNGNNEDANFGYSTVDITKLFHENIPNVNIDTQKEPGFEVITRINLPPRQLVTRGEPLSQEDLLTFLDKEGRLILVDQFKEIIYRGGVAKNIRPDVWKLLLGFYDYNSTDKEKEVISTARLEDYFRMKLQWKSFTADQESRFSALRDRKSLIEKDASRTDRTHPYFEGENNPNIQMLQDILMTYCMYNFDLGYVQGMSDLLSPILVIMQEESEAFWCFTMWLKSIGSNFEMDQLSMKKQLQDLHQLLNFVDNELCNYLENHDSGNMYFAFRWLLILFKRDFKFEDTMRLWEVLWTGLPCKNFHLLISIAILDSEKSIILENNFDLTAILKHVNEMSYKINLNDTLSKAEAIFLQIKNSECRSDIVESILGLDPVVSESRSRALKPVPPGFPQRQSCSSDDVPETDRWEYEHGFHTPFDMF